MKCYAKKYSGDDVVFKVTPPLSKWKLKTLSKGGRLTLIKSVITPIPLYHMSIFKVNLGVLNILESIRRNFFNRVKGSDNKMSWINWNKVLASKKYVGLGVSSSFALNRALLFKWVWRFFSQGSSLWTRFIKRMYGESAALDSSYPLSKRSPWLDIIHEVAVLRSKCINQMPLILKKIDCILGSLFWEDIWIDGSALKHQYPRLYALEMSKQIKASGEFSVKSVRSLIYDPLLPKEDVATRYGYFFYYLSSLPHFSGIRFSSLLCVPYGLSTVEEFMRWWELKDIDLASYDDWLL
ncbi:hypothetical protein Tco_0154097 [Tanacetum coccineum]